MIDHVNDYYNNIILDKRATVAKWVEPHVLTHKVCVQFLKLHNVCGVGIVIIKIIVSNKIC